ncbi:hypothetical protein [Halogeometricum borinquense]|uniref:hypothetical protein n=1 Tax=Halogeometricum borinquense TaxID=60847 RepID=UPI001A928C00|nr:hypothetical protein [Halogeometricum borinquense]
MSLAPSKRGGNAAESAVHQLVDGLRYVPDSEAEKTLKRGREAGTATFWSSGGSRVIDTMQSDSSARAR